MRNMKKAISAILAVAMTAGTFAANAATMTASAASAIDTRSFTQQQFTQQWNALINMEKAKFPEKVNGKQCYWNHGGRDGDGYSTSPCGHGWDGSGTSCNFIVPDCTFYDSKTYKYILETGPHNSAMTYGQCAGFAVKLQTDIFQTGHIIRLQTDQNGYYTALNNKKVKYDFKPGDSVRFSGHSIFITAVNGDNLTFAQCNADSKCGIDWDATSYKGTTITASYLKKHLDYIDRPMLTGDLNLDGKINSEDLTVFNNTVKVDGTTIGNAGYVAYDFNYDNMVDEKDYNLINAITSNVLANTRYVNNSGRTINSRWKNYTTSNGNNTNGVLFKTADGGVYSTTYNSTNGITFYGNFDRKIASYTIPSTVKNPATGVSYNVTEVGFYAGKGPGTFMMQDLRSLTIPASVKKINQYAFNGCSIQYVNFSGTSTLMSIGDYAFNNCDSMYGIILPKSLETIGKYAFASCDYLNSVSICSDSSGNCQFYKADDYAFTNCPKLTNVEIPNNLRRAIYLGDSANVFDTNKNVTLRLPNGSSTVGLLYMNGASDVNKFRDNSLLIYAGNYTICDKVGTCIARHSSTGLSRVYPN